MCKPVYIFCLALAMLVAATSCKKPDFEAQQQAQDAGTISDYLVTNFDFSLFAAAVQKTGLMDSLNQVGATYTIMAPLNAALNKDGVFTPADFDKWTPDSLRYFVHTHILPVKLFFSDIPLASDNRYANQNGVQLYLSRTASNLTINGVIVQRSASLSTSTAATFGTTQLNGVVYALNCTVKVLPATIQDFLAGNPRFTHLVAGLKKFGYWERLQQDGPFTLFAPADSSFERYGITLDSISRMDTARFDPIVFGGYFLTPNHVFIMDISNLPPPSGTIYLPFATSSAGFKTVICQQPFGMGVGIATTASTQTSTLVSVSPNAAKPYGQQGTLFLNEGNVLNVASFNGTYINYTLSNGIVHLLSDLLVMPNNPLVQK